MEMVIMLELDNLFDNIRHTVFELIEQKNVDIDILAFDLGIDRKTFINNFMHRIEDFSFYLQTITLLEKWEV